VRGFLGPSRVRAGMGKKDASQAKFERFELFGISEQFDALFLRKIESIFAQKWNEIREKVRAILSESHAKNRRRLQKQIFLKAMQHKGFSKVGAVKSWQIFAKN
jgi:hypothetical protein